MKLDHDEMPISPYSLSQMDNFYQAFAAGKIKSTSVMNYVQHLFIAQRCKPGDWVLDVCCGRGLQVPLLKHEASSLGGYVGVDISHENLQEAASLIRYGDGRAPSFPCKFLHGDVTMELTQLRRLFDVVIYTSALEHMDKEAGMQSLEQVYQVLHTEGSFYLSTPRTPGPAPKTLQHHVHVYEWDSGELEEEFRRIGFTITACYGLLPPSETSLISAALRERFGDGAVSWFEALQQVVPEPFLGLVCATALPEVATELLYILRRDA